MAEEETLESFKSADDMSEDELENECFLDECDEDATLSEDELLAKYEDEIDLDQQEDIDENEDIDEFEEDDDDIDEIGDD